MSDAVPLVVDAVGSPATLRLPLPDGAKARRFAPVPTMFVVAYHLLALLAFVPWFFSWTGVGVAVIASIVFGALGIALCYHRLLAHRSFRVPKWLEHTFAVIGVCCIQDTPARWVAVHRRHHEHADEQPDPHSPWVSFFWAHMAWVVIENEELSRFGIYERYARDLLRDPFYKRLERGYTELLIILASWAAFYAAGFLAGLINGGTLVEAVQFGASFLVWGVFVRTVLVWHQTWAVNSVSHLWGYRNYPTPERSRNNVWVGLFSNGEGWHNNHHAFPRAANVGHKPGEIDTTYWIVRALVALGLATDVKIASPRTMAAAAEEATLRQVTEAE